MNKSTLELAKEINRQINVIMTQAIKDGFETISLPTDVQHLRLLCGALVSRLQGEVEYSAALYGVTPEKYWETYCLETEKSDGLCL